MNKKESILETLGMPETGVSKKIKSIKIRIEKNRKDMEELKNIYYKAAMPDGYSTGTSYNDYDSIHGSRKEYHIEDLFEELKRLENMIYVDEEIIRSLERKLEVEARLSLIDSNKEKVRFLRMVVGYTQNETGNILKISERQIQRIEKEIKNEEIK